MARRERSIRSVGRQQRSYLPNTELPQSPSIAILPPMPEDRIEDRPATAAQKPFVIWIQPVAWLICLVLFLYFFTPLSTVILGVLAACIIACTVHPLMRIIPGPRGVDLAVIGMGMIAIIGLAGLALSWPLKKPISQAVDNWPKTRERVNNTLESWSREIGLQQELRVERMLEGLADFLAGTGGQRLFSQGTDIAFGILVSLAFMLIGSLFLLSEPPDRLINGGLRLFAKRHQGTMRCVLNDLAPRYRRWVLGTFSGMFVVFAASLVGYKIIGLELAIPLALLAGLAEIVPTVGPAVACVIAALFAAATQSAPVAAGVLVVYGIVQAIEAYLILPLIMRGAVNMHPAVTLFTVVLWGKIFGVPGLILTIPINLTLYTLLEHFRIRPREAEEACASPAPPEIDTLDARARPTGDTSLRRPEDAAQ